MYSTYAIALPNKLSLYGTVSCVSDTGSQITTEESNALGTGVEVQGFIEIVQSDSLMIQ